MKTIRAIENGEREPTLDTVRFLDDILGFDESLRSVLLSREMPNFWVPGYLLACDNAASAIFRWAYYRGQENLEQCARRIRYCTAVLSTSLSPPGLLQATIAERFGHSKQAQVLASQVVRRSKTVCERLRRGDVKVEALCLLDETRHHFRTQLDAQRETFIGRLWDPVVIEMRIITAKMTDLERRALSFAMIDTREGSRFVAASDQPLPGQVGRDCRIESERGVVYRHSEALYFDYWNHPKTYRIEPGDLRGI